MLQSKLFSKTLREAPKDEISHNAVLLTRAGYIDKVMAGTYTYLPLGLKVLNKIKNIIRNEMSKLGAQEILMPALSPKELWMQTERWDKIDVLFKLEGASGKKYALCPTHEEVVTPLVKKFASSYKDLPVYVFQIQDKFRNEPRAKSGLLRGREFSMKDLYSFHADEKDLDEFYEKCRQSYLNIFDCLELKAKVVEASGGIFSEYSHEFQVITPFGEDNIVVCQSGDFAQNTEICQLQEGAKCPHCGKKVVIAKAIEVGNIFKLKAKFSQAFNYQYTDENGKLRPVLMGCYGIGPSRIMGSVVEIYHDEKGIIWPKALSPYQAHLILLDDKKKQEALRLYKELTVKGFDILFDERAESAGIKLKDADLIGITLQLIVGEKTIPGEVEFRLRNGEDQGKVESKKVIDLLNKIYK